MKILVAIPVYDGKLPVQVVRCLLNEQMLGAVNGDELSFRFLPSCSHAAMGRNQLADDFLKSDAERLVFLDADVSFARGALLRIAHHAVDIVGGAYRYKHEPESYPVAWIDGPMRGKKLSETEALLEVRTVPGGFMSVSRGALEKIMAAHPGRNYEFHGRVYHCFYQFRYEDGALYGEDTYFCREWRAMGGKVYLDPELELTHWDGNKPYPGHIGAWLKSQAREAA